MNRPDCLYIVIPCYNEEQVLPVTSGMFLDELLSKPAKSILTAE